MPAGIFWRMKMPVSRSLTVNITRMLVPTVTTNPPQERALLGVLIALMYYTFCASSKTQEEDENTLLMQKCTFQRALTGHSESIKCISWHRMIHLIEIDNMVRFGVVWLTVQGARELQSLELPAFYLHFENAGYRQKCRLCAKMPVIKTKCRA